MAYLEHHGILGQKWGIRRYQNKDGTLTETGKKRNKKYNEKDIKKEQRRARADAAALAITGAVLAGSIAYTHPELVTKGMDAAKDIVPKIGAKMKTGADKIIQFGTDKNTWESVKSAGKKVKDYAKEKTPNAFRNARKATGVAYESAKKVAPKVGSAVKKSFSAASDAGSAAKDFFVDNKETFKSAGKKTGSFLASSIKKGAVYVQGVMDKW